jgi:hypothetical protein
MLMTTLRDRSRLAHQRYEGGVDTLLNALDADRELFNSELDLVQTKRDELLSVVQLYKALGGLAAVRRVPASSHPDLTKPIVKSRAAILQISPKSKNSFLECLLLLLQWERNHA